MIPQSYSEGVTVCLGSISQVSYATYSTYVSLIPKMIPENYLTTLKAGDMPFLERVDFVCRMCPVQYSESITLTHDPDFKVKRYASGVNFVLVPELQNGDEHELSQWRNSTFTAGHWQQRKPEYKTINSVAYEQPDEFKITGQGKFVVEVHGRLS